MASLKEITLPHGTIPTQMFGNVNLQNAMMYANENFAAVKDGVNSAISTMNESLDEKADADHDHDDAYSALEHTHAQSEVVGLSSALDGKADLNHEHTQYLSSLPAHYHDMTAVQGLGEALQAKAERTHAHSIAQVENLATELGVKASIAYVTQQVSQVSGTIKTIADEEIVSYAADKADATKTPKDAQFAPANETDAQKKARIGTSDKYAREDHVHVISASSDAGDIVKDGDGEGGTASVGSLSTAARTDHSHPLNYPSQQSTLTPDGVDDNDQKNIQGRFGTTKFYTDLGHSHALNINTTQGFAPSDVVKNTGSASPGTSKYYAQADHVHKMPALAATDISYNDTTVGATLTSHNTRITALENAPSGGGTVKKVDGKDPDANGNVVLNALTTSNYGTTLDSVYQAKSDKLTGIQSYIDENGKVLLSGIQGDIGEHSGDCYVTIDDDGNLGHSLNASFNLLSAAADEEKAANKLITDKDVGSGIEADDDFNLTVKADSGIEVTENGVSVKIKPSGGIDADEEGIYLGGLSTDGFVKSESGSLVVPAEQPMTLPSGSGYLKSDGSVVSASANVPATDVNFGDGVTNVTSANISSVAVTSVNGAHGSVSVTPFPGFGTSHTTASYGDHTHSQYEEKDNLGDAAYVDIDVAGGVQGYSGKLTSVQSNIDTNGKVLLSGIQGDIQGHTGNCLVTIDNSGALGHSGNKAYNLLDGAADENKDANKIITDKDIGNGLEADAMTHNLKVKVATNGCITSGTDGIAVSVGGTGFVKSTNGTLSVPSEQPMMLPSGSGFIKTNGSAASVSAKVSASTEVDFGTGVTNITTANIAANAVTSVNGGHGAVTVAAFPGFGTSHSTAAYGDHTHSQYAESDDLGDAAYMDVGVANGVQGYSAKLDSVQGNIDSNGKVLLSGIKGNIDGHTGNCLVTIDNSGALGHSGNAAYNLLNNAANSGGEARGANKLITDLDVGDGIEANGSHNIAVKAATNGGIDVTADGVSVKVKDGGGVGLSADGLSVNVAGTGFVKAENGTLSVPQQQPMMLPSGSGYMKSDGTTASVTANVPVSDVNFGTGVTNVTSANFSNYDAVTSVNGNTGAVSVTPFPGFGTTSDKAATGNHTHTQSQISGLGTAATKNVGEANGVQAYSAVLTGVSTGGLYESSAGKHEITSGAHYLATAPQKPVLLGVAQGSTAVTAREAIGTDMVSVDNGTTLLNSIIDSNGDIDAAHVYISDATGSKVVETDSTGGLVESSSNYAKFTTAPTGGAFVKTNGTDGTLEEDEFEGLSDDNPADVGTTASEGTSTTASRADHVHALPTMSGRTEDITASGMLKLDISHASSDGYIKISFFAPIFDKYGRYKGLSSNATWEANKILIDWS